MHNSYRFRFKKSKANICVCGEGLNGAGLKQIIMNVNWLPCLQSGEITSHYKHIMFQAIPQCCSPTHDVS